MHITGGVSLHGGASTGRREREAKRVSAGAREFFRQVCFQLAAIGLTLYGGWILMEVLEAFVYEIVVLFLTLVVMSNFAARIFIAYFIFKNSEGERYGATHIASRNIFM